MSRFRIGLVLETLRLPLRPALARAAGLGAAGAQVDAVDDLAPERLSQSGRRDLRNLLRSLGLELTALGCPLQHGFDAEAGMEARLDLVRQVMTMAYELGPRVVLVYAGKLPVDEAQATKSLLHDNMQALARHGDRIGTRLALVMGTEPPSVYQAFAARFEGGMVGLNFDPAQTLARGHDPAQAARLLGTQIAHTHARDVRPGRGGETAVGNGDVDWFQYLGALEEIGYHGWLTVHHGPCADPLPDLTAGIAFLKRLPA